MANMVKQAELMELFEVDFDRLIAVGHKQGMSYPLIFHAILERLAEMIIQCQHEEWLNLENQQ